MYVSELDDSNSMTVKAGIKDAGVLVLNPGKGLAIFPRYRFVSTSPILRPFTLNKSCIFISKNVAFQKRKANLN